MQSPKRQSGSVLIVVIMLLLLASVMTFFTLNVGVFEQHTSGNDLKAKMVGEVAEAGLSQGAEYLHSNPTFLTNTGKWTQCTATDTTFPCGSIDHGIASSARRATMYRWSGGGYDFDGNGTIAGWELKMLPITGAIANTGGGFSVQYGVGAVLCRVAFKTLSSNPTTCTDSGNASNTSVITLVSVASIPGEGARTTATQSIGSYNLINNLPALPPIVASGTINLSGGITIVTNPNSGGTGNPVSVWSPEADNINGTGQTCYANDYYTSGGTITWDPALPSFPLCAAGPNPSECSCPSKLTGVQGNSCTAPGCGIDWLTGTDHSGTGGNAGLTRNATANTEFPCDLFQKVFNVQAWEDDVPTGPPVGDGFCETHILTTYTNPNDNTQVVTMGVDEAYLYANADYIKAGAYTFPCVTGVCPGGRLSASALRDTSASHNQTVATQSGLVWCQDGTLCATGTAAAPVLVVIDGGTQLTGTIFGVVFARTTDNTSNYVAGATKSAVQAGVTIATGGNATVTIHQGTMVYGSVIVQGTTGQMNGHSGIIYNQDVLTTLQNSGSFPKFGGVPGGWTDSTSY